MDPCENCSQYLLEKYRAKKFNAPLPWIGMYVAAASLICSLAMAADAFHGFRSKKLWFPSKFFTLNAASLTLLAVAMKMLLDLTTSMPASVDQLAKLSSTVLMTTVLGNFMPSLATMDNKEILTNITALGIFVITMVVNVSVELSTSVLLFVVEHSVVMFFMLVLFVISTFSALIVPTTKKYIELKYSETQKAFSSKESEKNEFTVEKRTEDVKKYWMMAETGSLQFVMARSVTCSASGVICFLTALILAQGVFRVFKEEFPIIDLKHLGESDYKWSTIFIAVIQTAAVGVGTIAPAFRWLTATNLKCSQKRGKSCKTEFKVENYWIERLVEWKESPLALQIRDPKFRKLVQGTKNLTLDFCIKVQISIVLATKLISVVSIFLGTLFSSCYHYCSGFKSKFISESSASKDHNVSESETGTKLELGCYVVCLEGEGELPERVLKNIGNAADRLIQKGKNHKPKFLKELLEKSTGFKGVADFDSDCVPSLNSQEPPNCWALPVVTLTSIAIAITNIKNHVVDRFVGSVSEGLLYVNIVERSLDAEGDLTNIRNAADMAWLGVELYHKWLDEDLCKVALEGTSSREILERLADIAKNNIMEFKRHNNGGLEENPLNWPIKIIAANSMYRISQTILLDYESSNDQTEESLFEKLSVMIAEILGACLTSLPRVISMKCFSSAIERREKSVQHAARLLGETEEILKLLQQYEFPCRNAGLVASIDEWRATIRQKNTLATISESNNDAAVSGSVELPTIVELEP